MSSRPYSPPLCRFAAALACAAVLACSARVPAEETKEWAKFTSAEFEHRIFPGGHFFLKPLEKEVVAYISSVVLCDPVGHTAHAMPGFILFDPNAKN